jgi:hypothetical protein
VPYTITSHRAATPQDVDKPGDFSGGSRQFTSSYFNNLGLYAWFTLSLRVSRRLQDALEWLVSLTRLILAERVCPDPLFFLFRVALAMDYLILIFNYQGGQGSNSP